MATHRGKTVLAALVGLLGLLCLAVAPGHAGEPRPGAAAFRDGVSAANDVLADTLIAKGAESLDRLRTLVADDKPDGRAYELLAFARLLRALGRSDAAFDKQLRTTIEGAEDPEVRKFARAALDVLGTATPLGEGREDGRSISPRKLVAALADGNEHRVANNVLVDQLLLHGPAALPVVLQAVLDPTFEGRGYAAWAAGVLVRGTGADPRLVRPTLEMAKMSRHAYVCTLARSSLSILSRTVARAPVRSREPNPYIVRANAEAPSRDAPIEALVRAMPKRKGHWQEVVLDRLIAHGAGSVEALAAAAADGDYGARAYAAWGLARLVRALGRPAAEIETALKAAGSSKDQEVREYVAAGRRVLGQVTPLGSGDEDTAALKTQKLIGALVDGQVGPNNVIVDQLLLRGESAIGPLLAACKDAECKAPFYAAWALAKVLRATGQRPEDATGMFKARYEPDRSPRIILGL